MGSVVVWNAKVDYHGNQGSRKLSLTVLKFKNILWSKAPYWLFATLAIEYAGNPWQIETKLYSYPVNNIIFGINVPDCLCKALKTIFMELFLIVYFLHFWNSCYLLAAAEGYQTFV